jgi:hypothetical protein
MKTIFRLLLICTSIVAYAEAPLTNDVWITITGIDNSTDERIGISIIPLSEPLSVDDAEPNEIVLSDGKRGMAFLMHYPKWVTLEDKSTMITFTNQTLEGIAISEGYEHRNITLSKLKTNVVIRLKAENPNNRVQAIDAKASQPDP